MAADQQPSAGQRDSERDDERMTRMFRTFAEREFVGSSEVYTRLSAAIVERPDLADPLYAAPPRQRRAILYFAAAQYLLRTSATGHRLSEYLPVLGGTREPDDGLVPAFADLVSRYGPELGELCASRTTQTNEPLRAALLRPAFGLVARLLGDRPVGLVELGTSAGLLLLADRYGYRYTGPSGVRRVGRADPPHPLLLDCEVRGEQCPEYLDDSPLIASRTGIDLHPVEVDDPDQVTWLRSCIWPEHVERLARLDAALGEAREVRPPLIAGDMVGALPEVLAGVSAVPLVFSSNATTYLPSAAQDELVRVLDAEGRRRDLILVVNEAAKCGADLFTAGVPAPTAQAIGTLTVVAWLDGQPTVEVLARTGPHGSWLSWQPQRYRYAPPALG
ncbi:MAG TPA: DUF2332 domain-containing protein [Micromonosporaceae bacterium]